MQLDQEASNSCNLLLFGKTSDHFQSLDGLLETINIRFLNIREGENVIDTQRFQTKH